VLSFLWNHLRGYERLKERADRLFLASEFERARREYEKARSVVGDSDHRAQALDALIHSCERQMGSAGTLSVAPGPSGDEHEDVPPGGVDDLFELAIADKPESRAEAYRILGAEFREGYVTLIQGRAERAASLIEEAASRASSSFVVHLELGRALSLAGRLERARDALEVASRLSPDDEEGRLLEAAVNVELGRFAEARSRLAPLAEDASARPEVVFLMGKALAGLNRSDDALEKFRHTVKLEPHFHEAFFEAGCIMKSREDVEAAFQLLSRAAALAPDEIAYNRELARLVLAHPLDEDPGLAACDRLMLVDEPNRWEYLHWVAELYLRRGWHREARDPLEKALGLVPSDRSRERRAIEERLESLDRAP
jgi:tetratricopeptide (TPR) repeat protein